MKHLKTKLMAAVAMLVISAVMLTGVSYAWYTLSTNPEVKNITATAVANDNLEIALDNFYTNGAAIDTASSIGDVQGGVQGSKSGNDYTWGNSVDVANQMTASSNNVFELRPAEYVGASGAASGLQTYKYGTDGRISAVQALKDDAGYGPTGALKIADTATASASQVNGVARVYNDDASADTNYAFKVVYWLRTNTAGNIDLCAATGLADGADTDDLATGSGSYISTAQYGTTADRYPADAIHVAFKVTPDDTSKTATWVADTDVVYTFDDATTPTRVNLTMATGKHIITGAVANQAYKVEMYVFLNGDVVTNAMAENAIADIKVNVQFDNDAIATDGAMQY